MHNPFTPVIGIDQIETDWSMIHEPAHLVMRYARAVEIYLQALIRNRDDAEEVGQEFFLLVSKNGLPRLRRDRGRFRDYLKKCVRNAVGNFQRRGQASQHQVDVTQLSGAETELETFDHEWTDEWRRCILDGVWRRLREYEENSRGSLAHTVLRLHIDHPEATSEALADKVVDLTKKPIRPDAFRQQLSRARRQFAQFLVDEVAQTLSDPDPRQIEDELVDLGLLHFVRNYLPLRRRVPHRERE